MAHTLSSEVQSYLGSSRSSTPHAKNSISRTSNASRHVRELLGRQLIVLRDTSEYDDEALLKRIVDRARLLGFDPDPGVIAERFQRLIGDI